MQEKQSFESKLTQLSLFVSLPLYCLLLWMMVYADISIYLILLTTLIGGLSIIYCHIKIHQNSAYQFRSLSNLLDAMIQGDYSLRARLSHDDQALNELINSINDLSNRLNKQRIESIESQLLLRTVIDHIDVAIIALNEKNQLVLVNPVAQKLLHVCALHQDSSSLKSLEQLERLPSGKSQVLTLAFEQQQGKYNVHMEEFREAGQQHKLIFLTDVSTILRSEERNAWQSLVRVISHEINNSLAPIASISQTLKRSVSKQEPVDIDKNNLLNGLTIVAQRASNLTAFVNSYKQIARLPEPKKQRISLSTLLEKIAPLYQNQSLLICSAEDVELFVDPIQLEQALINLLKNAFEAMQTSQQEEENKETGKVELSWQVNSHTLTLLITDEGVGISNAANLFVPFYSTKQQGSGIGLVLCRQILEVHDGRLNLINRTDRKGCIARIELPL